MTDRTQLLVVDDEPDIVEELTEYLASAGYTCYGATSPARAREIYRATPAIGIVMVDLRMPEEDGLTLLRGLKQMAGARPLEAIVFTGHGAEDDVIEALRLGVGDYQKKPVDVEKLAEGIRRAEGRLAQQHKSRTMEQDVSKRLETLSASLAGFSEEIGALRSHVATAPAAGGERKVAVPRDGFAANLTARQWDVLRLITRGLNNYQIACELGISENTVKLHVSHILKVAGMNNRTQLALAAAKWDGLDEEPVTG